VPKCKLLKRKLSSGPFLFAAINTQQAFPQSDKDNGHCKACTASRIKRAQSCFKLAGFLRGAKSTTDEKTEANTQRIK
jgi:hypothetical protein